MNSMPIRQILVCSFIFLAIVGGAAFLARGLSPFMSNQQSRLNIQQMNVGLRNPAAFQPREYIRIVPLPQSEGFP